jgi:dihydroneopterin aldolase
MIGYAGSSSPRFLFSGDMEATVVSGKALDRLTLNGIKLQPRIGVSPGERRFPQPCHADVAVWGDFEAAASTDSLDKAINYSQVLATVLETAHAREYNLLETLAYRIARDVLQSYPATRVRVSVRKRPASLAAKLDHIEVEVEDA